jgi:hypothetical protein
MLSSNGGEKTTPTIQKTLLTATLIDGFWDRWIAHGVEKEQLVKIRSSFLSKESWIKNWCDLADQTLVEAYKLKQKNLTREAEQRFRTAALYYQLVQWLIPDCTEEKREWLNASLRAVSKADQLSTIETKYVDFEMENSNYFGRIRIPSTPKGVIVIVNPLDSAKEELFTYELDFANNDYVTVSFDGPGQGETYTNGGGRGTTNRWKYFINKVIDYTYSHFPHLSIHLFGTSSGASWAIYGSCNPKVAKTVAVSPAFLNTDICLPDYFVERTQHVLEEGETSMLPSFDDLPFINPIFLVHGKKDVMVSDQNIGRLYQQFPINKKYKEYPDEGHCCNYKLSEIRHLAMEWFQRGE